MADQEIWKPILDWEGMYEISSYGRVKRVAKARGTRVGKIVSPRSSPSGHVSVSLSREAKGTSRWVHILVAEAFHGQRPSDSHEVAHGNGIADDNHCANLRWATHAENENDKVRHGTRLRGERVGNSKLCEDDVRTILASDGSSYVVGKAHGVTASLVQQIRLGKVWRHISG